MSDITPIHRPSPTALNGVAKRQLEQLAPETAARKDDRVEFSNHARLLSKLHELPPIREGLVASVREEIEADRYETPERLDAAVDALIEDLV